LRITLVYAVRDGLTREPGSVYPGTRDRA